MRYVQRLTEDGMLMFNVLSIGNSWETCLRGMDKPEMLGFFTMEQVFDREVRVVNENSSNGKEECVMD